MYTVTAILMSGQEMILGSDASARAARKFYNGAISMPGLMTLRITDPAGNSITIDELSIRAAAEAAAG